jgi:hypothetical protein
MAELRFPQELYEASIEVYRRHKGRLTWGQAQELARDQQDREAHAYASAQAREDYAHELPSATADERFEAAVEYQRRNPHLSFEQAAAALGEGETFVDEVPVIDAHGVVVDRPGIQHYARKPSSELSATDLRELVLELGCSEEEAERFWHTYMTLVRSGKPCDTAWAEATVKVFTPEREHKPPPAAGPLDSTPTEPRHQRVAGQASGSSGPEGFFVPSANAWSQEHATVAPPREIPMQTSGAGAGARRTRAAQSIPAPAPGLTPMGYSKQSEPELDEKTLTEMVHYLESHATHTWEQAKKHVLAKRMGSAVGRKKPPREAPVGRPPAEPVQHQRRYDYGPAVTETTAEAEFRQRFRCLGISKRRCVGGEIWEPVYS